MYLQPTGKTPVEAFGYDENTWTCSVRFAGTEPDSQGVVYAFADVPPELFADLEAAPSPDAFVKEHLLRHPYTRTDMRQSPTTFSSPEEALTTAQAIAREIASLEITTPEAYQAAGEELVRLGAERRRRLEFFRPMKEAAFAAHKTVCARENEALAPLREAEKALQEGLVAYRRREELARRERQAAWELQNPLLTPGFPDEWTPDNASMMTPTRNAAETAGQHDLQTVSPEIVTAQPVLASEVPHVAGLSFATDWDFEVVDPRQVPLSHEWYSLDERKIRGYVKRMREHAAIPGIRVFPKERSRTRVA